MAQENRDEGANPDNEPHLTPSTDEDEDGRVINTLDDFAEEEDAGGSGDGPDS